MTNEDYMKESFSTAIMLSKIILSQLIVLLIGIIFRPSFWQMVALLAIIPSVVFILVNPKRNKALPE
jgi:hypothetical protein